MNSTLSALGAYRIMWLFVMFDLPVLTKIQKKRASKFRKELLKDGFAMMQFSVYARHCPSKQNAEVHVKRVRSILPREGHISILRVTDKQFSGIINIDGFASVSVQRTPAQLEFF